MRALCGLAAALVLAAAARGQGGGSETELDVFGDYTDFSVQGDHGELLVVGGVRLLYGTAEMHADRAVVLVDRDEFRKRSQTPGEGLPRRDLPLPDSRRKITDDLLRRRLQAFLRATGRAKSSGHAIRLPLGLVHHIYLEGKVTILNQGLLALKASSLSFSPQDDRAVFKDAEMRLRSTGPRQTEQIIVVRGKKLVRQGIRTSGRDVSVTSCTAGEPHFEVVSGEVEIIERKDEFEVRSRDSTFSFSGVKVLPLPNMRFFTGEQRNNPIRRTSVGFDSAEGAQGKIDLGLSWSEIGGPLHEFLTGRPASEFRGDVVLGLGFNEQRGFPLDAALHYGADDLYDGKTRFFYLDDDGPNRREIRSRLDGTPIDGRRRLLVQSENRVHLGEATTLDLTLFQASDAAVLPEFHQGLFRQHELPETSMHLRDARENRLFTATARANLASFSFADDRSLAPSFVEELPLLTYDVFAQPLFELPWGNELLLSSSTSAGYLRTDTDRTANLKLNDDTLRIDHEIELAAPFHAGPINIRPFVSTRVSYFDDTATGGAKTRGAFAVGASAGTWLSKTWSWSQADGSRAAIRHVISPLVTFEDRFRVDGNVADFHQFDQVDALTERSEIRFELLNRLQLLETSRGESTSKDFFWLDLAQTILPNSTRDNGGEVLGLLEYEFILRPAPWVPVPGLQLLVEGEHDWRRTEARTINTEVQFGKILGVNWVADYRTDRKTKGSIGYGASTDLFGRWFISGGSQYDLERKQSNSYTVLLTRADHDWRLQLGLTFDVVTNNTTFFFEVEPTLGGLLRPRSQRVLRDQRYFGGRGFDF